MKTLQVRLPDAIHGRARRLAADGGMSLNQFMVTSISNEMIRQETSEFFARAAAKFDPEAFAAALEQVPSRPVGRADRITPPKRREA